jgi:hypothetical protein
MKTGTQNPQKENRKSRKDRMAAFAGMMTGKNPSGLFQKCK